MKRLFSVILGVMVVSLVIISCKDEFNEQDFLQLQSDLKIQQDSIRRARNKAAVDSSTKEVVQSYINAQNQAGSLMAVTVIVREDNTPVAGVTVTISSGTAKPASSGKTQAAATGTTDASGTVVFDNAVIANSSVTLSKTGYVSASALIDFGSPGAPVPITVPDPVTGGTKTIYVSPQKVYENVSLPMYSESATGSTAMINGVFSIENDMTNAPDVRDPIPGSTVVTADIAGALANNGVISGTVPVSDYRFSGAAGSLGVAAVDPVTGAFSMRVPAMASGMSIDLILPRIAGTSKMAIRRLNGADVAPAFMNVPTVWEPGNASTITVLTNNIPQIPGAMAVINTGVAPPAPGRGFSTTFAAIARGLGTGTISANGTGPANVINNTAYNFMLRGRGFSSSPAVTITGGGGTGAIATSSLRGFITSATVTAGGAGYTPSTVFEVQFTYTDANASIQPIAIINVTSSASGDIPLANLVLPNLPGFAPNATAFTTTQGMQGFGVRVENVGTSVQATATTQATITFTNDTEVNIVAITNGGSGFTSAPTLTFSGGGSPSTQAAVAVATYKSQYTVTLSTTPATTPYKLLPAGFVFTYATNPLESQVVESPAKVDRLSTNLSPVAQNADFIGQVVTDGTNLSALDPQYTFRTSTFWTTAPTLTIVDQTVVKAAANLLISAAGEVTSIINPTSDSPTINDLFPTAAATTAGDGYDGISVVIQPTISGAPGSGASFLLTTTNTPVSTKEVTWTGGSTPISVGSGYMQNLNRATTNIAYSGPSSVFVQTGQTYNILVNAGHGIRLVNVSNQ